MIEAYPLCWPRGRPRTRRSEQSRFRVSFARARDGLREEIRRLGGRQLIISTNVPLRRDGLPYASVKEPADRGVAVYFDYQGQSMCFACDKWASVAENIRAIEKTIEALRGIARWGTGDMMERAFTGFAQLEHDGADNSPWWEVLDVDHDASPDSVRQAYRRARRASHPDMGGDSAAFHRVQQAYEQAQQEGRA